MQWADDMVSRAVLAADAARGDEALRQWLLHLHSVQRLFLDVWRRQPPHLPDASAFADAAQIVAWAQPYYAEASAFLDSVAPDSLAAPLALPWAAQLAEQLGMTPATPTLGETMFQVTSHSTYHRGQINARLRAVGGTPPLVDYIAWIWFGRPAAGSPLGT
jgi:uncharacterized damage-inducible protein DinB